MPMPMPMLSHRPHLHSVIAAEANRCSRASSELLLRPLPTNLCDMVAALP